MVTRRVQTRLERKRTGPEEWLVVTRRPLADDGTLEGQASPDATRSGRPLWLSLLPHPDSCSRSGAGGAVAGGTGAGHQSRNVH